MSRSKHQTGSSVTSGRTRPGADAHIDEDDDDLLELLEKRRIRRQVKERRREERLGRPD